MIFQIALNCIALTVIILASVMEFVYAKKYEEYANALQEQNKHLAEQNDLLAGALNKLFGTGKDEE